MDPCMVMSCPVDGIGIVQGQSFTFPNIRIPIVLYLKNNMLLRELIDSYLPMGNLRSFSSNEGGCKTIILIHFVGTLQI